MHRNPDGSRCPQSYPPVYSTVLAAVRDERIRAHRKHDDSGGSMERLPWDAPIWLAVLTEEVGEVARALCEDALGNTGRNATRAQLRDELVQVAAMACAWYDAIDDEMLEELQTELDRHRATRLSEGAESRGDLLEIQRGINEREARRARPTPVELLLRREESRDDAPVCPGCDAGHLWVETRTEDGEVLRCTNRSCGYTEER